MVELGWQQMRSGFYLKTEQISDCVGSIVERLCSDLDRKEPRYQSPTLLYFTLLLGSQVGWLWELAKNAAVSQSNENKMVYYPAAIDEQSSMHAPYLCVLKEAAGYKTILTSPLHWKN